MTREEFFKYLLVFGAIFLVAYSVSPEFKGTVDKWFASQDVIVDENVNTNTNVNTGTSDNTLQQTIRPVYQIGTVNRYVKDALDKKSGVSGVEVEVLDVPEAPYTHEDLVAVASDIYRNVVDEDTSTDSSGKAVFSNGAIFTETPYIYAVRGGSTYYDRLVVDTIPAPVGLTAALSSYTFPAYKNIYVYKVGSFSTIASDTAITCSDDSSLNVTANSGTTQISVDITIGEATSGAVLLDPVIVFRGQPNYEPPANSILHIYLTRKTGTAFDIPSGDLVDYYETETPIHLGGSIYDADYGKYLMGVQDSGTYTLKIQYDADTMTANKVLEVHLDDLGDYRAMDEISKDRKASPQTLTFTWCS